MNVTILLDSLSTRLGLINSKIAMNGKLGRFSQHVDFEDLFIELINITYDMNLVNANTETSQYPGIDAIDIKSRTVVQITSDTTAKKVIKSLELSNQNNHYLKGENFKMAYLKDKKPFSRSSVSSIKNKVGKFNFDPEKDFYTLDKIYKTLYTTKDFRKIQKCLTYLDDYIGYLPSEKTSGVRAIAVSFDDDDCFEDSYLLIEQLLVERINVFTHSKKMYNYFKRNSSKYFDGLIYQEILPLDYVNHFLFILSSSYVSKNLNENVYCKYLNQTKEHDLPVKIISFQSEIEIPNNILGNRFRTYTSVSNSKEELEEFANELFSNFFNKVYTHIPVDLDLLLEELDSNFNNFIQSKLVDEKDAIAVLYTMRDEQEIRRIYVVAKPGYTNKGLQEFINGIKRKRKESIHILIPKNPLHKTRKALENVKKDNNPKSVKYIDEFLFEKTADRFSQKPMQIIQDFVQPVILKNKKTKFLNDIISWINDEDVPSIGIIKAGGGIGKTTLAERIHDILIDSEKYQFLVVFINSIDILKEFKNANFEDLEEYDLFNLFKKAHPQGSALDETSFYNNYSQGNILMILDGIDEVISTVASFTLVNFLNKLNELNKKIGRGKILITCRDIYIDEIDSFVKSRGTKNLQIYELLPFNVEIAEQYLLKHNLSSYKIKKGVELLKQFVPEKTEVDGGYIYPPYVLEVIIDILENEGYDLVVGELFDSNLLIDGNESDYILYQIFAREEQKKSASISLSVDDQTSFFCHFAINFKSKIETKHLEQLFNGIRHYAQVRDVSEVIKDHPLLKKSNGHLIFRYSFLTMEFYTIGVYNLLKQNSTLKLNDSIIDILGLKANYNSIISKGVLSKLNSETWHESSQIISWFRGLMQQIYLKEYHKYITNAAISNLFIIAYKYFKQKELENFNSRQLLIDLFGDDKGQGLKNLYLINIPSSANINLDFSDLFIEDSEIDGFSEFVVCKFSKDSYFLDSCKIKNITTDSIKAIENLTIDEKNFHEIQADNSLAKVFKLKQRGTVGIKDEIRAYFQLYFNGNVISVVSSTQLVSHLKKNYYQEIIHKICVQNNLILEHKERFQITGEYKSKIQKFVFQGRIFKEIKQIVRLLPEEMKSTK